MIVARPRSAWWRARSRKPAAPHRDCRGLSELRATRVFVELLKSLSTPRTRCQYATPLLQRRGKQPEYAHRHDPDMIPARLFGFSGPSISSSSPDAAIPAYALPAPRHGARCGRGAHPLLADRHTSCGRTAFWRSRRRLQVRPRATRFVGAYCATSRPPTKIAAARGGHGLRRRGGPARRPVRTLSDGASREWRAGAHRRCGRVPAPPTTPTPSSTTRTADRLLRRPRRALLERDGNGWEFPIDKAAARVFLPGDPAPEAITAGAYTGRSGGGAKTGRVGRPASDLSRTRGLGPREGLTIVVRWPKGW